MKTAALLVLVAIKLTLATHQFEGYSGPELTFKVFTPCGFAASIADENGIEMFEFHGNVNTPMIGLEKGQFRKKVFVKSGRRWVVKNNVAVLKIGDVVHFWVVVSKNGMNSVYSGQLVISDISQKHPHPVTPSHTETTTEPTHDKTTESPSDNGTVTVKPDPLCSLALNLSRNVEQLTKQVESSKEIIDILKDIISNDDDLSKTLKLEGVLPAFNNAQDIVEIVLQEKLDLRVYVVNATTLSTNSVKFRVLSLNDKILIIKAAKEKLEKTKSKISVVY